MNGPAQQSCATARSGQYRGTSWALGITSLSEPAPPAVLSRGGCRTTPRSRPSDRGRPGGAPRLDPYARGDAEGDRLRAVRLAVPDRGESNDAWQAHPFASRHKGLGGSSAINGMVYKRGNRRVTTTTGRPSATPAGPGRTSSLSSSDSRTTRAGQVICVAPAAPCRWGTSRRRPARSWHSSRRLSVAASRALMTLAWLAMRAPDCCRLRSTVAYARPRTTRSSLRFAPAGASRYGLAAMFGVWSSRTGRQDLSKLCSAELCTRSTPRERSPSAQAHSRHPNC